jgi:hypothetical protein
LGSPQARRRVLTGSVPLNAGEEVARQVDRLIAADYDNL